MKKSNEQPSTILKVLLPTVDNVLWIGVFLTVLLRGWQMVNADGDLPLHLTQGRFILDFGRVPLQDLFSHTQYGQLVVQHKWLGQAILALVERYFSLNGVVILSAIVIACSFWLVFKQVRGEGRSLFTALFVILLASVASMVHWLTRPHLFTFLFLAAWMIVLNQFRKGNIKLWWLLPVMMALWVNLHGGFIAGLVTWFFFGLGILWDSVWQCSPVNDVVPDQFWRYYLLGGAAALGATLINPSGIELWQMIIRHLGNEYLAAITVEFQSPNFHDSSLWPFLLMIGLLVMVMGLSQKKAESREIFNATVWLFFGLYSGRNIPLFAIAAAPLIVQGLDDLVRNAPARIKILKRIEEIDQRIQTIDKQLEGIFWPLLTLLFVVVGLTLGFRFDYEGLGYQFDPDVFPVEAVDWLEDNPQEGEMFNSFMWGGYLQYRLWPEKRVFIDSNSDFYGEAFVRQYMKMISLEDGWEGLLDQYEVTWAILPPEMRVVSALKNDLGWDIIYQDETAVILKR